MAYVAPGKARIRRHVLASDLNKAEPLASLVVP
jgi:hypothetical protein